MDRDNKMRVSQLPTDWGWALRNNRLFQHMESMPRLPVPELEHTLAVYLQSVKPFLTASEYPRVKAGVDRFAASPLSRELQTRLLQHAAAREAKYAAAGGSSWLAEWWDNWAYLDFRDSLPFYVSYDAIRTAAPCKARGGLVTFRRYFYHFRPVARCPDNISRAAELICGFTAACLKTTSGELEPEMQVRESRSLVGAPLRPSTTLGWNQWRRAFRERTLSALTATSICSTHAACPRIRATKCAAR
jgi:hypothetical protein